jgi:hypothetical protein
MILAAVILIACGGWFILFGVAGQRLGRRWTDMDPGDRGLGAIGQFQLARQRSFMRQAPFWRVIGFGLCLVGGLLLLVAIVAGS